TRILDGSGNPWFHGEIAILNGRIAAIGGRGELRDAPAEERIDAQGRVTTPGFIDVHSHTGSALTDSSLRSAIPLSAQGITTVIVNPDGGGPVNMADQRASLESGGLGVHVAQMVPHGSLRRHVVGLEDRDATPDELEEMKSLVRQAMEAGAVGLSSGLFYAPGSFAPTEELVELARVVAEYDGVYQSHIRDESDYTIGVVAAVEEVIRIAEESGATGVVSHIKVLGPNVWGESETLVQTIRAARERGVDVVADQYPYNASATSLSAALMPRWALEGGGEAFRERLEDSGIRQRIREEAVVNLARRGGAERISIRNSSTFPQYEAMNLQEIARDMDMHPLDAALRLLEESSPGIISFNMQEEDIETLMREPFTMTSSDGGLVAMGDGVPHPRNNGSFARKISRYVMERGTLTLEDAVRRATSLPARTHKLMDRGLLLPGYRADLLIFDPQQVRDHATFTDPHQLSTGFDDVMVNGEWVRRNGDPTGQLPGNVLTRTTRFTGLMTRAHP
ncbi:MAG: N-acyl-D-amino-acid deacylase family protein, partial [Bacteroidota bacterium]